MSRFCPKKGLGPRTRIKKNKSRLEFDEGATNIVVWKWRYPAFYYRIMSDYKDEGILFHSPNTSYFHAILFELPVILSRQRCSVQSSSYLRKGYHELCGTQNSMPCSEGLPCVASPRSAVRLYINLTIKVFPLDVTMCDRCRRKKVEISIIFFDGLQLAW